MTSTEYQELKTLLMGLCFHVEKMHQEFAEYQQQFEPMRLEVQRQKALLRMKDERIESLQKQVATHKGWATQYRNKLATLGERSAKKIN